MKKIYLVVDSNNEPVMAYEYKKDAVCLVENLFGKSITCTNNHIKSVIYEGDVSKSVNAEDYDNFIEIVLKSVNIYNRMISETEEPND